MNTLTNTYIKCKSNKHFKDAMSILFARGYSLNVPVHDTKTWTPFLSDYPVSLILNNNSKTINVLRKDTNVYINFEEFIKDYMSYITIPNIFRR